MMKKTNTDKNTSHKSKTVLLLIDVITDFEFEDGEKLLKHAAPMAQRLQIFKKRAVRSNIPVIYINDNFGNWRDDFSKTVKHCLKSERGGEVVKLLKPEGDDYFVLKPKHSAFYSTTLDLLLEELEAEKLILTGVSTDICVLFTANDAYMRDFKLIVPSDCVASVKPKENEHALKYIERVLKADVRPSEEIRFD